MAATAGINVKVYNGSTLIATQRGTTLRMNGETIDVTTKDSSGWRAFLASWKDAEIALNGLADINGATHEALFTAYSTDAALTLNFALTSSGVTAQRFTGSFFVTNLEYGGEHEDAGTLSATFRLNGALAYNES